VKLTRSRLFTVAALAVIAIAAVVLLTGGGDDGSAAGGPAMGGPRGSAAVTVAAVTPGPFVARAEYVGTLEARAQADLYARSSGPIVEITADLGDRVREGQVLARIEPAEERQRLEQARANLRIAEATLTQRGAALRIAETTAERTRALFEQNLVSRQQNDAVEADLDGARAQAQLAEAQVSQARAALSSAEVELDQTRVVAPFDGVVGRRYLDRGAFAAASSPVMSLVDLSTIKTTIALPERDAPYVVVGQPATVRVGSLPGVDFAGRVARVGAVFDPDSATSRAEVEVDNLDGRLKPGMFATVTIALDDEGDALLVPQKAVLEEGGRSWVFVVGEKRGGEAAGEANGGANGGAGVAAPGGLVARRTEVRNLGTAVRGDENGGSGSPAVAGWVAVDGALAVGQRVITLGHEALTVGDDHRGAVGERFVAEGDAASAGPEAAE